VSPGAGETMQRTNAADLFDRIQKASSGCPMCGKVFGFTEGHKTAREAGIEHNVLMCPGCQSVFEIQMGYGGFRFTKNITAEYAAVLHKHPCSICGGTGKIRKLMGLIAVRCKRCGGSTWEAD
jgi:hypothetical protein